MPHSNKVCPHCRQPLKALTPSGRDLFCRQCYTSVAITLDGFCLWQLATGQTRKDAIEVLSPTAGCPTAI